MLVQAGALVRAVAFSQTPRQPSSTEVPMRLIGLAIILALARRRVVCLRPRCSFKGGIYEDATVSNSYG